MNIHCLQHVSFEGLGSIEDWVRSRGHTLSYTRFYQNDALPSLESMDLFVIMGGPMSIFDYQSCPWLLDEKRFIEKAINSGKTVLGICLGAQLVADVLDARVYQNSFKEIGWYPVEMTRESSTQKLFHTFPSKLDVFHWHGDTFDLPKGAVHLARNSVCDHQAFIFEDRVIGLQFHLEMTEYNAKQIVKNCTPNTKNEPYVQSADSILSKKARFTKINDQMESILNGLESSQENQEL